MPIERDPFSDTPSCVLFVGINGAGKTTTVGKIASAMAARGKNVVIGSADTFRAAAIEQLDVWGQRAGVPVIKRDRGSDPASVCYDVLDEADKRGSDLVLIDTAGRLHTSPELMRELAKVVNVTRKRAANMAAGPMPVYVVLVIDAATGQNGLNQALEFNEALGLDGIIMTKLDGRQRAVSLWPSPRSSSFPSCASAWASRSMTCRSLMPKISAAPWWASPIKE